MKKYVKIVNKVKDILTQLRLLTSLLNKAAEVPISTILEHKIKVVLILSSTEQFNDEGVVHFEK